MMGLKKQAKLYMNSEFSKRFINMEHLLRRSYFVQDVSHQDTSLAPSNPPSSAVVPSPQLDNLPLSAELRYS
jgi:hypothetical protein